MRCAALIEERVVGWRASRDRSRQCKRQAQKEDLCRQHAGMLKVYCGGHRAFLYSNPKRRPRFYCSRCGKRFRPIYSQDG